MNQSLAVVGVLIGELHCHAAAERMTDNRHSPPVLRKAVHQHHRRAVGRPGVGDMNRDITAQIVKPVLHASEFRK